MNLKQEIEILKTDLERSEKTIEMLRHDGHEMALIALAATARADVKRKENAQLRRELAQEHATLRLRDGVIAHWRVRMGILQNDNELLQSEVCVARESRDELIEQLINRGHELAELGGRCDGFSTGIRIVAFVGRVAQALGLS